MAFALQKVRAYGDESEEAVNRRYRQTLILNLTGLATDIDLDIGDYAGTFWTAVSSTEPGTTALRAVKSIQKVADSFLGANGTSIARKPVGPATVDTIVPLLSGASVGGSASETLVLTGALTTDTVLGAVIQTQGANVATLNSFPATIAVANQFPVVFSTDPGVGAKVLVTLRRNTAVVQSGTYQVTMNSTNTQIPELLFLSGNAPTSYVLVLEWVLQDQAEPVQAYAST